MYRSFALQRNKKLASFLAFLFYLTYIRCRKITFRQRIMFIDSFIGYLKAERNYSAHTLRAYGIDLRAFEEYLSAMNEPLSLLDVDADVVRMWISSLMDDGAAVTSVNRKLSSLRTFYSYLRSEGEIEENPVLELQGPKRSKHLPTFVREEDMNALLDGDAAVFGEGYSACCNRTIILCFYETGIRLSELVELNLSDVDLAGGTLKVFGKRSRERIVPLTIELKEVLASYLEERAAVASVDEDALFVNIKGTRVSRSSVYRLVRKSLASVSTVKKKSPHVLRHTFATAMLNNEAELGAVKELLGHKRLATTEVYTHLTFEELKKFYKKAHPRAGNN